jgi:hypothetical protein|tara:strand:- start:366 stop:674 length:309 start_codon:yes stop_codon:yes gene_type:complete
MNSLVTNLYPRPNGTISGENLSCATSGSGVSFAAFDSNTKYVMIDVQDNNVIVTFDGSAPTASNGHLLIKEKELITLSARAAKAAKFLGVSGASIIQGSQFL